MFDECGLHLGRLTTQAGWRYAPPTDFDDRRPVPTKACPSKNSHSDHTTNSTTENFPNPKSDTVKATIDQVQINLPALYLRCGRWAGCVHTVADDVPNQEWDERLDRCTAELLSGLLAPPLDLGGTLDVVAPFMAGQLGCHLDQGLGSGQSGLVVQSDTTVRGL